MSATHKLRQIAELVGHEDRAWNVAWNPSRPLLASCSADKTVRLYHYTPTHQFQSIQSISTGHTKTVRSVAWAPSGKTFATGSFDSNIGIWQEEHSDEDGEDGGGGGAREWECASMLEGHETECKGVAYSSTGTLLASCSRDKTVWVWEVLPDAEFECVAVLMNHSQDVKCVAWHPTEEILASGSYDDKIKLSIDDPDDDWFDFETLSGHESTVWSLAFSPCGNYLASSSEDLTIRIWRRADKYKWRFNTIIRGHDRSIYSISWGRGVGTDSSSLGWLATTGSDGKINIWNVQKPTSEESDEVTPALVASVQDAHGVFDVNSISWCPRDGFQDVIATAGDDNAVRVWKVEQT